LSQLFRMPQPFPFEEIIADLDAIDRWLREHGLEAHDRIRTYRKNIRQMIAVQESDEKLETLQNITDERLREIVWSYVEAEEFVRAVLPLRAVIGADLLAVQIKKALDGPADLYLETRKNNRGRNFMFELIMGGRMAKGGFIPVFDQGPDVQFQLCGLRVAMQCKRPFSIEGLEESIGKAIAQLKADAADLSIIAVSVSRLWNAGDPREIPILDHHTMGHPFLDARIKQIAHVSSRFWKEKLEHAAIFFYGYSPIRWRMENGRFGNVTVRAEIICPVTTSDEPTKQRLKVLIHELGP